ncbi:MAG: type II toxin-antitoxin system MqsR family toxin [Desulfatirhabdiaceae bacterium]
MTRTKPYYSQKEIRSYISDRKVEIRSSALQNAQKDFGWGIDDIYKALSKLPLRCWYKSEPRYNNPQIWVDYYRCPDLNGENIYTHFYVDNDRLIIDSFKRQ